MKRKKTKKIPWNRESLEALRNRVAGAPAGKSAPRPTPVKVRSPERTSPPPAAEAKEPDDEAVFREAMQGVRELPEFHRLHHRASPTAPRNPRSLRGEALDRSLSEQQSVPGGIELDKTDEYIEWAAPGIRQDLCWAMHRGRIPAQDRLDLHGLTLEEARVEVERFIRQARQRGLRSVSVVHGRGLRSAGGPVLKIGLCQWIETGSLRKFVMAYATAPQKNGGAGATYLLLRT